MSSDWRNTGIAASARESSSERASVSFFALTFVFPFFLLLCSLVLDLKAFYLEREACQQRADSLVFSASRYLPYSDQAREVLRSGLQAMGVSFSVLSLEVGTSFIALGIKGDYRPSLAQFFGVQLGVPYEIFARSRIFPASSLVVLDNSRYLAPGLESGGRWGSRSEWPASSLFDFFNGERSNASVPDSATLTQQCFNPAFSALKRAAIGAYDYLNSFQSNRTGAVVVPGALVRPVTVRPVLPFQRALTTGGEAAFEAAGNNLVNNEFCAAIAERAQWPVYRFPSPPVGLRSFVPPDTAHRPAYMIQAGSWSYSTSYNSYLTVREVLWSRAARSMTDFADLLTHAEHTLLGSYLSQATVPDLNGHSSLFLFMGDVPWIDGLRYPAQTVIERLNPLLKRLEDNHINLFYLLFKHPGNEEDFDTGISRLHEQLQSFQNMTLIVSDSSEEFERLVINNALSVGRESLLSR